LRRRDLPLLALLVSLSLSTTGCGSGIDIDTTYGRTRGRSINGTGTLAEILRGRGHEVRAAIRTSETLADWADVIVRFSPQPGPIDRQEGAWLTNWLNARPLRRLVYVPRDFDAEPEFWEAMLAAQPKGTDPTTIRSIEAKRSNSKTWSTSLPSKTKTPADPAIWFEFEPKAKTLTCKKLEGPWSEGVDGAAAAITRHEVFKVSGGEEIFLSGDQSPLAIGWTYANDSRVLVVANASFLLNASLLNHARRPLAIRVVDWLGSKPTHVAFLEGRRVAVSASDAEDEEAASSQFHLLGVAPFGWLAAHLVVFLLLFAFSFAVRLGRPIPEPPSGVERPSAHPEALGALLAKTRRADAARFLLESYRRWRHHSSLAGRTAPTPPPPR
jgi:hypothetical protein